ncbi:PLD-like domain protein [Burkholderia pseudomallei]|nr:PLD-like domain protein [Burkholderia pseudomallei]
MIDAAYFSPATVPDGFETELRLFPGEPAPPYPPVVVHHKFVVIDAEGANPIVYSGSANMSANSEHYNDENLLEIRDARIAGIYLAEFLRLYEHYRARARWRSPRVAAMAAVQRRGTRARTVAWRCSPIRGGRKSTSSPEARRRRRGSRLRRRWRCADGRGAHRFGAPARRRGAPQTDRIAEAARRRASAMRRWLAMLRIRPGSREMRAARPRISRGRRG